MRIMVGRGRGYHEVQKSVRIKKYKENTWREEFLMTRLAP